MILIFLLGHASIDCCSLVKHLVEVCAAVFHHVGWKGVEVLLCTVFGLDLGDTDLASLASVTSLRGMVQSIQPQSSAVSDLN